MKSIRIIIVLLVGICTVKAQERVSLQNIVLSPPVIDSIKINSDLDFCGIVRDVNINCLDNEFAQREDEIWRKQIKIQSDGAKEIEIVFQRFVLSPNAVISFHTVDSLRYQYQGSNFAHKPDSSYISNFLHGDVCLIIIEIPVAELDNNQIVISQIHHLIESFEEATRGEDYSCMIDANCSEGNDWCNQKRSVAIFYFTENGGRYRCTGALVNNYRNNFTQYFLTARHCTNEITNWSTTSFYFNHQHIYCNVGDKNTYYESDCNEHYKVQGSQMVGYCDVLWSDNALLLITEPIPIQYNVYYSGVDITKRSARDGVTIIHHPKGMPKKITSGKIQHFAGPRWEIYWDNGTTFPGSSGAPVFLNSNKRVIANNASAIPGYDCSNNYRQSWVGKVRSCNDIKDVLFGNSGLESYAGIDPNRDCQSTFHLQGKFHSTQEYDATLDGLTIQAGNTITVSNAVFHSESNYTLTAGDRIVLQTGTSIRDGSTLSVKIAPCSGNLVSCGTRSSKQKNAESFSQDENITFTEDLHSNIVTIYPNPNNGTFTINTNFDTEEILFIQVYNTLGQCIYKQVGLLENTIQLPQSAQGMFWVKIMTQSQTFIKKIVVQ